MKKREEDLKIEYEELSIEEVNAKLKDD